MAGCRSLKKAEYSAIINNIENVRDRTLIILGVRSGFRISELLSLKVSDVCQGNEVLESVRVQARKMKGGRKGREIPLHSEARQAIGELVATFETGYDGPLFRSRKGDRAISRVQAHRILKNLFKSKNLQGKLATHTMRKTFAETVHKALGNDIYKTAKAMGHESIDSTAKYIAVDSNEINKAILST
jgi:site-specific recombinase XerD